MQLFPSTLIVYQSTQSALEKVTQICQQLNNDLSPNNPDLFVVDQEKGWTIATIRLLKKFLSKKPFNHQNKIAIIFEAHNLNKESQNALLKSLEEPGQNNYLFLTTNKKSALVNTILSRCHLVSLKKIKDKKTSTPVLTITNDFSKDSLKLEALYRNKDDILPFLKEQLSVSQQQLINNPNQQNSYLVKKILKAIKMTEARVDPRNALDLILLS
jgi:DNA polymerase III delta prime subunit